MPRSAEVCVEGPGCWSSDAITGGCASGAAEPMVGEFDGPGCWRSEATGVPKGCESDSLVSLLARSLGVAWVVSGVLLAFPALTDVMRECSDRFRCQLRRETILAPLAAVFSVGRR